MALNPKEQAALNLIKEDISYENYFFDKISGDKWDIKWLMPLKNEGYFSVANAPGVIPAEEEGYFSVPQWNVLPYLEKVAENIAIPDYELYIREILGIINEVTASGKDNYRTFWFFIKILLKVPNELIPLDTLDHLRAWVSSKFGSDFISHDIATKLLPKFLPGSPTPDDIKKAEMIFDLITTIKPASEAKGSSKYDRAKEQELAVDRYWYLKAINQCKEAIGRHCSRELIENLINKVEALLKVSHADIDLEIDSQQILLSLKEDDTSCLLQILDISTKKPEELIGDFIQGNKIEGTLIKELRTKKCTRDEFIKHTYSELEKDPLFKKVDSAELKRRISNAHRNLFNGETYHSLYSQDKHIEHFSSALDLLVYTLKNVLNAKAHADTTTTISILNNLMSQDYFFFPKLAMYIIGRNFETYSALFWALLTSELGSFVIEGEFFGDELRHILEQLKELTPEQQTLLQALIENGPRYPLVTDDPNEYLKLWKQKRYDALSAVPIFKERYDNLQKDTGANVKLSASIGEVMTQWGSGPSPLANEQLLRMSNKEIADYLAVFKTENFWEGPTIGGLSDTLRSTVQENPDKFTEDLSPYINTSYLYVYDILAGLREAWKNEAPIDWGALLAFVKSYIDREEFWSDALKAADDDWHATHEWVAGSVSELIQEGTRKDSWAFDGKHIPLAKEILFIVLERISPSKDENKDAVFHALNSAEGKALTALILIALRIARLAKENPAIEKVRWSDDLKNRFESALSNGVNDAYTLLGQYMPNLLYLDKTWTEQRIQVMETLEDDELWNAFMEGYLFGVALNPRFYELMKDNYKKALTHQLTGRHAEDLLTDHIGLGYLWNIDNLSDDGPYKKLIDDWNLTDIDDLVSFFWRIQNSLEENKDGKRDEYIDRILKFWQMVYSRYASRTDLTDVEKKLIAKSGLLAVYLEEITDENLALLLLSAKYIHTDHDSAFFIEALDQLKDRGDATRSAKYIGQIFAQIIRIPFCPDYDREHIRSIVRYLYERDNEEVKALADEICNAYAQNRIDLLTDLYQEFNQ
ncbi:MAG: hypothetical protein KGZ93_04965 [Actinobacteria bacterium]|nr:hypothetical protein [Actinomycetota bacterium]